ncbi:MAG: FAD-dependent oxidoreductase [Clostridium sp.]|jgi:thioredoxin reductase (NADPH)|nr:FAD-dependent oxidoreductase [Clostridium sp.]
MRDLIIVGSGPAGLSAAVYAKRAGLDLLVMEKSPMSGGQILNTYEVDNYLGMPGVSGFDLGMKFREHADKLGVAFREAEVTGITVKEKCRIIHTEQEDLEAGAVILATGAAHAKLQVPGETELTGAGVSYCATCDGAFFRGKTVAVVGGGDVALEDASYLARFCEKVYVIHRRKEFRGAQILQEKLKSLPNVEILCCCRVNAIRGERTVESLILEDTANASERELPVSGVFLAVGIRPNTEAFRELVDCDESGYILAGEDGATNREGIYAAGDIRKKPLRQVVTAVADGANAAVSAGAYLNQASRPPQTGLPSTD